jgi:membrane-bound lytic murein transglycosylase B
VQVLAARARAAGVSEATIQSVTADLAFNPRVIELIATSPAPAPARLPRLRALQESHVDAARIGRGRAMYRALPDPAAIERAMACRCRCCWRSGARKPIMAR